MTKPNNCHTQDWNKSEAFFCHLALTYSILFPYLKGLHLTLSSHLPKRNEASWKLSDLEYIAYMEAQAEKRNLDAEEKEKLLNVLPNSNLPPPSGCFGNLFRARIPTFSTYKFKFGCGPSHPSCRHCYCRKLYLQGEFKQPQALRSDIKILKNRVSLRC